MSIDGMSRLGVYGNAVSGCSFGAGASGFGVSFGGGATSDGFAAAGFGFSAGRAFCAGSGFCCANAVVAAAKTMTAAALFMTRKSKWSTRQKIVTSMLTEPWASDAAGRAGRTTLLQSPFPKSRRNHGRSVDDVHRNPLPKPLPAGLGTADGVRRQHHPRLRSGLGRHRHEDHRPPSRRQCERSKDEVPPFRGSGHAAVDDEE